MQEILHFHGTASPASDVSSKDRVLYTGITEYMMTGPLLKTSAFKSFLLFCCHFGQIANLPYLEYLVRKCVRAYAHNRRELKNDLLKAFWRACACVYFFASRLAANMRTDVRTHVCTCYSRRIQCYTRYTGNGSLANKR